MGGDTIRAGVADIRSAVAEAEKRRQGLFPQRTILFVDEVHRFNKAQQDALLPHVENGLITLIGATTENPFFEVNKALVSRSRIFRLESLSDDDLRAVARHALSDVADGYGALDVVLDADALDHLVKVANGDARGLLNALELAVETTPPDADGRIHVDLPVAEESIQRRAGLDDKGFLLYTSPGPPDRHRSRIPSSSCKKKTHDADNSTEVNELKQIPTTTHWNLTPLDEVRVQWVNTLQVTTGAE